MSLDIVNSQDIEAVDPFHSGEQGSVSYLPGIHDQILSLLHNNDEVILSTPDHQFSYLLLV